MDCVFSVWHRVINARSTERKKNNPSIGDSQNQTNNNNAAFMAFIAGAGAAGPCAASSSASRTRDDEDDFIACIAFAMVVN